MSFSICLSCRIKRDRKARYDRRPPMDKTLQTRCATYSSMEKHLRTCSLKLRWFYCIQLSRPAWASGQSCEVGKRNSNASNSSIDYRSIVQLIFVRELYFERNTFERRSPQFLELSRSACTALQSGSAREDPTFT
jgi:hypothetical protein